MRLAVHEIPLGIGNCWMSSAPGNRGALAIGPIPLTRKSVIIAALAMSMAKKDPLIPLKYAPEPGEPQPRIQHSP